MSRRAVRIAVSVAIAAGLALGLTITAQAPTPQNMPEAGGMSCCAL